MKQNINECNGCTQPSAVSGIRQDLYKIRKVEESSFDKTAEDASIQFGHLVKDIQDTINDYIDIVDWNRIPAKIQIKIKKFQNTFDTLKNEYGTSDVPDLFSMLSEEEQNKLLYMMDDLNSILDNGFVTKNKFEKV